MAQAGKGRLNYRCPACFMRDYYCLRCCYVGSEEDVQRKNQLARFRYRAMLKRFREF